MRCGQAAHWRAGGRADDSIPPQVTEAIGTTRGVMQKVMAEDTRKAKQSDRSGTAKSQRRYGRAPHVGAPEESSPVRFGTTGPPRPTPDKQWGSTGPTRRFREGSEPRLCTQTTARVKRIITENHRTYARPNPSGFCG